MSPCKPTSRAAARPRSRVRAFCSRCLTVVAALATVVLLVAARAGAQEPVDHDMVERIRSEGLERSGVHDVFNTLTQVIGPRLSGSPGYMEAAEWTRDWLEEHGLREARLEAFEFGRGWSLEKLALELTAPRYAPLTGYAEAWTPSTRGVIEGRPFYIGDRSAKEIEAMGERLRGAIVLTHEPQTVFTRADREQPTEADEAVRTGAPARARGEMGRSKTPLGTMRELLQEAGAAAMLRPSRGEHGTVFVLGNRNIGDDAVPSLVLAAEQYNLLVRMLAAGAPVELRLEVRTRYHEEDTDSYNVLAEIPGTDPELRDEIVLIGAHLDSWHSATGATDNADGVASAMEAMRILSAIDARPRRTIRIALWGGEEQGLLGSRAYVARHLQGPENAAAHESISVYFNDDPGTGPTYGFYMEENEPAKAIFDAWLEPFEDFGARRNVIQGIPSTDHLSFAREGIPAFTAIKEYRNYDTRTHHTNADFSDRVEGDDLEQSAIVLASFAWHAAMRDERIPRPEEP